MRTRRRRMKRYRGGDGPPAPQGILGNAVAPGAQTTPPASESVLSGMSAYLSTLVRRATDGITSLTNGSSTDKPTNSPIGKVLGSPDQSNNSPAEDFPSRQDTTQTYNPLTRDPQKQNYGTPPQQNYGTPPQPNNGPRMVGPPNQSGAQSNGIIGGRLSRRRRRSRRRSRRRR